MAQGPDRRTSEFPAAERESRIYYRKMDEAGFEDLDLGSINRCLATFTKQLRIPESDLAMRPCNEFTVQIYRCNISTENQLALEKALNSLGYRRIP